MSERELANEMIVLVEYNCASCGIRFGIPETLDELRRKDYSNFYCPNGHSMAYRRPKKTRDEELEAAVEEADRLREELREAKDTLAVAAAKLDQYQAGRRRFRR